MLTERDKIEHLKIILIDYAIQHDNKNGGYTAIQSVQKMAGESSFKDYLHAIFDGISYGNWPWTNYSQRQIDGRINRQDETILELVKIKSKQINQFENDFCGICKMRPCQCCHLNHHELSTELINKGMPSINCPHCNEFIKGWD